ncbi:uncharacterized protein B0T23DRAFT_398698 [Neurospora hispaniola]|uniref:Uncharacterized protein n=1 Tax=Neurospora hispaniola TaxID=588809 RepID=A0AAJ0MNQ7_9PEZI|nr:hypothetical protein B0T23DRAFT_398698 [Neurospora hispaniola]
MFFEMKQRSLLRTSSRQVWVCGGPSGACDDIVDLTEEDQERLLAVGKSDLIGGNLISRSIAVHRLRNELLGLAEEHQSATILYNDTKEALGRLYNQVSHARFNYVRKVTYSELPMVKGIRNQDVKTISVWKEEGDASDWKSHLPARSTLLACRMANVSNSLPEQVTDCLFRLGMAHLAEIRPMQARDLVRPDGRLKREKKRDKQYVSKNNFMHDEYAADY